MNYYEIILIDADDTLLDFQKAESQALKKTFELHDILYNEETNQVYQKINRQLWSDFEKDKISKGALLDTRFELFLQKFDQKTNINGKKMNQEYLGNLGDGSYLMPESVSTCKELKLGGAQIYILTNGVSKTQFRRIQNSHISEYIDGIYVSEDIGFQKPQKAYFDYVFSKISNFDLKKAIMVGDSLSSDIVGGIGAGVDTCWLNANEKVNVDLLPISYQIKKLSELLPIVKYGGKS